MNNSLVSVVIPTYNRANLLPNAINSVINQTFKNWELIIVDDGSIDNTKDVISEFIKKDSRVKYFYQKNSGQPSAMNLGIKNSKGNYIAFLDDDDEWLPEKLEKQINKIKSDKLIGLVFTDAIILDGKTNVNKRSDIIKPSSGFVYKELLKTNFITATSVIIAKEIFEKIGLFDESFIIKITQIQDYDMWLRIAKYYKIEYISEPLVKYNYIQKINNWEKKNYAYRGLLYIYFKNFKMVNLSEFLILMLKILEYFLKLIISYFFILLNYVKNNNLFSIKK